MRLLIVHSHFRPGGVRRVIESALTHLGRTPRPTFQSILLVTGELPDSPWLDGLRRTLAPVPILTLVDPCLGYLVDLKRPEPGIRRRLRNLLARCLEDSTPAKARVWAHNLGLGRNPILAGELARACTRLGIPLVLHHHDWWFDNRWVRWADLKRSGADTLPAAARILLPASPVIRHASINRTEATILGRHFPGAAAWLPNPVDRPAPGDPDRRQSTRRWLSEHHGVQTPFWILPCRLLRRKNIAEALLLTRWLHPDACLITTGAASSREEQPYASALSLAATRHRWPLHLGVLGNCPGPAPDVPQLLDASEGVLLTSLVEGFGLPFLEAAAAARPLIARRLPIIDPDLRQFGFRFPGLYSEVLVAPELYQWKAERLRQERRFKAWLETMPRTCRRWAGKPALLDGSESPQPVPFSRLTLRAQLEILTIPPDQSWQVCAPLNPTLASWRSTSSPQPPPPISWPEKAEAWVGGSAYVRRLRVLLQLSRRPAAPARPATPAPTRPAERAQEALVRLKLSGDNLYPLLWDIRP